MFAQLCIDLNQQVDDLKALEVKFKAACAAATNRGQQWYEHIQGFYKHHNSSPPQSVSPCYAGKINTTVYNEIVGLYVQQSDEVYSNGVSNISNTLPFDQALQLCATSHAIVHPIQNSCVDCLLCVLFDSGRSTKQ
jgi:hypothetical protein